MKQRVLVYLTDDNVTLYGPSSNLLGTLPLEEEGVFEKIQSLLSHTPKVPCRLIIDRNDPKVEEDKLPPLFIWERFSYLFHKRKEWESQGGYLGFQFYTHKKETFISWVLIPETDPCYSWISWLNTLPNPFGGIFFASLEAGPFLSKMLSSASTYKMLIYPVSLHQNRYVILEEKRILLSRLWEGDEKDIKLSLHYLSRSHPSIHEDLQTLCLSPETRVTLPKLKTLENSSAFLGFLSTQKKPTLSLKPNLPLFLSLLRKGGLALISVLIVTSGINAYLSLDFHLKSQKLLPSLTQLEKHFLSGKKQVSRKNAQHLKEAIEDMLSLKRMMKDPFLTLGKFSHLIENYPIHLEKIEWTAKEELIFVLSFLTEQNLSTTTKDILSSYSRLFPKGRLQVIESPHHSSPHEEFKTYGEEELPHLHVKMVFP